MDIVTALGIIECLGIVSDRVESAGLIGLLEDGSHGILRGIDFKGVWAIGVGLLEDRVTEDNFL
jgi:hypothetical protein